MARWLAAIYLAALCFINAAWATAGPVPIPRLEARVTDLTGTLTSNQQAQLESQLASLERDKGAQVAILLLPTTQPESIEQFGIRLAEAWQIGRKGADDGVIVIVAKQDRAVRIEVGYGLEGAIPDAVARRIIEERITPRFREGDFFGGLQSATGALGRIIGGEALPASQASRSSAEESDWPIVVLFILTVLSRFARALFGLLGSLAAASLAAALAWWVFGSVLAAAVAALFVFFMSFARGGGGGSGWHTGGGGGFSTGGGGFSGGGGGFGGGGASGRW